MSRFITVHGTEESEEEEEDQHFPRYNKQNLKWQIQESCVVWTRNEDGTKCVQQYGRMIKPRYRTINTYNLPQNKLSTNHLSQFVKYKFFWVRIPKRLRSFFVSILCGQTSHGLWGQEGRVIQTRWYFDVPVIVTRVAEVWSLSSQDIQVCVWSMDIWEFSRVWSVFFWSRCWMKSSTLLDGWWFVSCLPSWSLGKWERRWNSSGRFRSGSPWRCQTLKIVFPFAVDQSS